jgi:hypothetical protein
MIVSPAESMLQILSKFSPPQAKTTALITPNKKARMVPKRLIRRAGIRSVGAESFPTNPSPPEPEFRVAIVETPEETFDGCWEIPSYTSGGEH